MDFNSYLTDFFSLLNNTGNIFGGNISGGAKPTEVTFGDGFSNAQIFDFYFDRSGVPAGTKITIDTPGLKLRPENEKEFINKQVEIVKYMLENSNVGVLSGGLFGGAGETKEELAAAVAAHLKSSECIYLQKIKNDKLTDGFETNDFTGCPEGAIAIVKKIDEIVNSMISGSSNENKINRDKFRIRIYLTTLDTTPLYQIHRNICLTLLDSIEDISVFK
jgi:hypothetical protein